MNARSETTLIAHCVWAVKHRAPTLTGDRDRWLSAAFERKAQDLEAVVVAQGFFEDHAHLVIRLPPSRALSVVIGQLKGYTAHAWNLEFGHERTLAWQDGYWAESCWPRDIDALLTYVREQRRNHLLRQLLSEWEPELDSPNESVR